MKFIVIFSLLFFAGCAGPMYKYTFTKYDTGDGKEIHYSIISPNMIQEEDKFFYPREPILIKRITRKEFYSVEAYRNSLIKCDCANSDQLKK